MTQRKRTYNPDAPWDKTKPAPAPQPQPETSYQQKAKHLPMFGPGVVITIPLHLLPEYFALYHLQPNGIQEPKVQPRNGPGEAILLVKRVPTEGK